ncbi:MAG: cytochrome c-type biogenesis protein CcmH [Chloroflexota bacterium]|nr:cytochrome c-type biogenesis protein CcmH [Chloroflexota bacterium]
MRSALFLLLVFFVLASPVLAQEPTLDEINAVARELYCPLCNGVRLDTCDLQACIQMRQVISDKLVAGVPKEQIKADFVEQYGPIVLGEPPRQGLNLLAWILPVALLLLGAVWLFFMVRSWTRKPEPVTLQTVAPTEGAEPATQAVDASYLKRIEADLEKLD